MFWNRIENGAGYAGAASVNLISISS